MLIKMNRRMWSQARVRVIDRAWSEYRSDLVKFSAHAIRGVDWPEKILPSTGTQFESAFFDVDAKAAIQFILLYCAINYRFWDVDGQGGLKRYSYAGKTGAKALYVAMGAAWGECRSPELLAERFDREGFRALFGDITDSRAREAVLRRMLESDTLDRVAEMLLEQLKGGRADVSQAKVLSETFHDAFADPYLKKAQLAVSMFTGCAAIKHATRNDCFDDSDLTAFADYQVPRVLRALGILSYCDELEGLVDQGALIGSGSAEECAIRAATILACEEIAAYTGATAAQVDCLLWDSQRIAGNSRFHLTETSFY